MVEAVGPLGLAVEATLHGAHPYGAVGGGIDGVDGIGRERGGVGRVYIVFELQHARHQLGNAARLGAHPHLALDGEDAVDEVAAQGFGLAAGIPVLQSARLAVQDVDAPQGADEQAVVGRDGQRRYEVVRQAGPAAAVAQHKLWVAGIEAVVGGEEDVAVVAHDVGDVASADLWVGMSQVGGDQSPSRRGHAVQGASVGHEHAAVARHVLDGDVGGVGRVAHALDV